jgi:hypothetical protein
MSRVATHHVLLSLAIGAVAGCSDSTAPKPKPAPNSVTLQSDAQDFVGGGRTYTYTSATAVIGISVTVNHLSVTVDGDERWSGDFQTPNGATELTKGTFSATRYPFNDPATGGLSWSGEGRGCNTLTGTFTIDSVRYASGALAMIEIHFEQHCEGATAALRGTVHWRADDATAPKGPTVPIPSNLWQPPAGSTPTSGKWAYLQSDAGDFIGSGQTYTYSAPGDQITVTTNGRRITIGVGGWIGEFEPMNTISRVEAGYYPGLQRFPFHNPAKGGFDWSGNGRGCSTSESWVAVDKITYSLTTVTALDLRFEQHCNGLPAALHGAIHFTL